MTADWQVRIPGGRWMAGSVQFNTKRAALAFIEKCNMTELVSGHESIEFVRVPGTKIYQKPA